MSRERARRRAEREQELARRRAERERRDARAARRRAAKAAFVARIPRRTRWRRQQGLLARRRRLQNGLIVALLVASQVVVWLLTPDPWLRAGALVFALLATPVLVTLVLDRRS